MYKAICTDIDGTLLNADRKLSERTIQAFQKVKSHTAIILASSRMPAAMRHLQASIGIETQPLICYNGGYVIDQSNPEAVKCISSVSIDFHWVEQTVKWCMEHQLHASLYFEDNWYVPEDDFWAKRESNNTQVIPTIMSNADVLKLWGKDNTGAHKIMLMGEAEKIDAVVDHLTALKAPLHLYRSKDTYLEIAPQAISKATAINLLVQKGAPYKLSEIIAFGDNFNDIEMLKAVGKGVAVANAKPEVLAIADEVTLNAKEDGVAFSIEKHF